MTATAALQTSSTLLAQLAIPAARGLILGTAAGLGLTAFRVKATSTRLFTWTAVLYAALAMPMLAWLLPPMAVPAPALLQNVWQRLQTEPLPVRRNVVAATSDRRNVVSATVDRRNVVAATADRRNVVAATADQSSLPSAAERRKNAAHGASRGYPAITATKPQRGERTTLALNSFATTNVPSNPPTRWTILAAALYLSVASILLARFLIGLAYGRRLIRASQTIDDPLIARRFDLFVRVAESEFISVPVTMGALRPTIVLPADWRQWDAAKFDAVLAHEVSHVARRDALTQRLSLLHRAIFWFSPLAWWLDRHLAALAEQASDEAALSCGADRKYYAKTLLGFFEALQTAPGRVWWQGVAMAKAGQAEQRVERILSWKGPVSMNRNTNKNRSIIAATAILALPVLYLAATAHPVSARAASAQAPASTSAPAAAPSPAAAPNPKAAPASAAAPAIAPATDGVDDGIDSDAPAPPSLPPAPRAGVAGGIPGAAPVAPIAPIPPVDPFGQVAQVAPVAPEAPSHRGFSYRYGSDDEQRFVIVSGKTDSFTMSGSSEDARHVEKLKKQISGDFIWFQRDEKSYVIRDQATVDRALKLWAPQQELGKKQEALGKQQEALGKQQEALGEKMQQVRVNVPDMTAELEKLKAELKQLSSGATQEQVGHIQSEIGELQSKIGNIQSQAGEQQGKLGEEMGALGEQQGKLGEEQGKLGRQQGELAEKASKDMKQLLDDAITKGTAQPEI